MCIFRIIGVLCAGLLIACSSKPQPSNGPSPNQPPVTTPAPTPDQPDETPPGDPDDSTDAPDEGDSGDGDKPMPAQGQPCPEGACADGLTCISYYGIAGSKGPKFTSCERPCAANLQPCPDGQRCVVIADGPGQVCRAE